MRIYDYESKEYNIRGFGTARDKQRMLERIADKEGLMVECLQDSDIDITSRQEQRKLDKFFE